MKTTGAIKTSLVTTTDYETLSKRWIISRERAKATVQQTSQRGVRLCLLAKRYPTDERMLRYNRLPHNLYTDTPIAGTKSKRGNKNAQVFASPYGWTRAYHMKANSDCHDALSVLFSRDGVPPAMIMDGSKEQTLGNFS